MVTHNFQWVFPEALIFFSRQRRERPRLISRPLDDREQRGIDAASCNATRMDTNDPFDDDPDMKEKPR